MTLKLITTPDKMFVQPVGLINDPFCCTFSLFFLLKYSETISFDEAPKYFERHFTKPFHLFFLLMKYWIGFDENIKIILYNHTFV